MRTVDQTDDPAAEPREQAERSALRHVDSLRLTGTLDEGDATTEQLLPRTGEEGVPTLLPGAAQVGERLRRLLAERRGLLSNRGREEHEQHGNRADDRDIDEQDRQRSRDVPPIQRVDRGLDHGRKHKRQQDQHQDELDLDQQVAHNQDQKQRNGSQADAPIARRGLRRRLLIRCRRRPRRSQPLWVSRISRVDAHIAHPCHSPSAPGRSRTVQQLGEVSR